MEIAGADGEELKRYRMGWTGRMMQSCAGEQRGRTNGGRWRASSGQELLRGSEAVDHT